METSHLIQVTKLIGLSSTNIAEFRNLLRDIPYNNEYGHGFKNIYSEPRYLGATLVKRTPTFIPILDQVTGQITEQEIFLFSEIEFGLDYVYDTLDVFGSSRNHAKVLTLIYPLLNREIKIASMDFSPSKVIPLFVKNEFLISVERLVVNNFQYKVGVSGRFDMRIDDPTISQEIIAQYDHDVTRANLLIEIPDIGRIKIAIASSGSLSIKSEDSEVNDIIKYIKSALDEGKE
jgi:hypothetical protein